jgi:hypothetical protein
MTNIYNLFKFLEDKEGTKTPFKTKLIYAPDTLTPDDLKVGGDLDLRSTKITSLPDDLEVKGSLSLRNTPLGRRYTKEEIEEMIEDKGGEIKGGIFV